MSRGGSTGCRPRRATPSHQRGHPETHCLLGPCLQIAAKQGHVNINQILTTRRRVEALPYLAQGRATMYFIALCNR